MHNLDEGAFTQSRYHPTDKMRLAGQLPDCRPTFNLQRESFLLDYDDPRTLRAYWSDLEQIADWADERGKNPSTLASSDMKQYAALLRRRHYSEHTIRRRKVVYSLFLRHLMGEDSQPGTVATHESHVLRRSDDLR